MTEELKNLYSYNPIEQTQFDTLSLSHSQFSQTYNLVKSDTDRLFASVQYTASGFSFTLPEKGSNQQDLTISINNVESDIINELESALAEPNEPIQVVYRTFIDTLPDDIQFELTLQLQEILVSRYSIEGRATSVNLFDSTFPRQRFDSWKFTGLTI